MGKIAFVFAGQGAQSVGMGKDLYQSSSAAKEVFDLAGDKITKLCFDGPAEELNVTINTQPCLFAMDLACARALNEKGIYAQGAAGFSLGEIPALAYSGLMSESQALDFVLFRAEVMQKAAEKNPGAMFAVLKLATNDVEDICHSLKQAYPVNYNCPGQIVIACSQEEADTLEQLVKDNGGKAIKLAVSGAFHSPFMDNASAKTAEYLQQLDFANMDIPLYANASADVYGDPKELLASQINSPVLWQKTIEKMIDDGFDIFIEVGAGKTLAGLIKKINPSVRICNVYDTPSLEKTISEVKNA